MTATIAHGAQQDLLAISTVRTLAMDRVQRAGDGHGDGAGARRRRAAPDRLRPRHRGPEAAAPVAVAHPRPPRARPHPGDRGGRAVRRAGEEGLATRVVSMPCGELFAGREQAYRDEVPPREARARLAVEAASPFGWGRWAGDAGEVVGVERFGASAPGEEVLEHDGFTADEVAAAARSLLEKLGRAGQGPLADLPA